MIFNKFSKSFLLLSLLAVSCATGLVANDTVGQVAQPGYFNSIKQIPAAIAQVPSNCAQAIYDETLGKRPGTCILTMGALFGAYLIREQYRSWNNARANTRDTILRKITEAYELYMENGNSDWGNVHNQQQQSVRQSLEIRKAEVLRNAQTVYNWGIMQDSRLIRLIDEFFAVLAKKTSGNQLPAAPAPATQPYWFQFWSTAQPAERILEDILKDIRECLMGSCG